MSDNRIRVMILEDRPEDAELMVHELRRAHFEPEWRRADTESGFYAQLEWPPQIILADYSLPLFSAPQALGLLRKLGLDIPFIVVSGAIGEEKAIKVMRQGATDYLLKDRLARLGLAVRRALEEASLRDEARKAAQSLRTSEDRFYSFMNHSPALKFIKDREGRVLYMNNTCERIWGLTLADCLGKADHQLWPPDVAARLHASDMSVLERGESSQVVEEVVVGSGRRLQLLTFRFPFDDAAAQRLLGGISIDITEQFLTRKALVSALATQAVLVKEVHHRVKNNLQVISSLLALQAESLQDPVATRALRDSQERVQCMALIHERLNMDEPDRLNFCEFVETLARNSFQCHGFGSDRIRLRFELEPVTLEISQAVPCGLILNELLTNALKYAFPNGRRGEILIRLKCRRDEFVELTISDDGMGFPEAFDWQRSQSLGLQIVNILSGQLDGTLERASGPGAVFTLTFPRALSPPARILDPPLPLW